MPSTILTLCHLQVGAMLTYTLDALRYREGALASIWLSLGATNLSLLYTTVTLMIERGIILSFLTAICNGALLFMTGLQLCYSVICGLIHLSHCTVCLSHVESWLIAYDVLLQRIRPCPACVFIPSLSSTHRDARSPALHGKPATHQSKPRLTEHYSQQPTCAGVWGTLQFRWVQLQYPVAIIVGEKLLLSASIPLTGEACLRSKTARLSEASDKSSPLLLAALAVLCPAALHVSDCQQCSCGRHREREAAAVRQHSPDK